MFERCLLIYLQLTLGKWHQQQRTDAVVVPDVLEVVVNVHGGLATLRGVLLQLLRLEGGGGDLRKVCAHATR